jgi:hypothetical protein
MCGGVVSVAHLYYAFWSAFVMAATGTFYTSNGTIIGPGGNVFTAEGINVFDWAMGDASQILADFPTINFIRLNCDTYQSASAYASFIQTMTAHGVVVEIEDHTNSTGLNGGGGLGVAYTGQQLTNELNWYSSLASAYANNPYVWFGTDNEPPPTGLTQWEQETYQAIRGTGNENPILVEMPATSEATTPPADQGVAVSAYTSMTNIIADPHFYGWIPNYSTNQQTVATALAAVVQSARTVISASGAVPVIIGEYGISTDGEITDANGNQVLTAVQQAVSSGAISGAAAWNWYAGGTSDELTDGNGNLSSYGQEVSNWMKTPSSSSLPIPPPTPAPTATASANDTTILAGLTTAIIDAGGNHWTITASGQVAVNGVADATTANVTELAYVNKVVWQENASDLWWSKTSPLVAWSASTATSPLPAPITASGPAELVVTQSEISVVATSGSRMVFVSGSDNSLNLSGGTNTISDTGTGNVYFVPAARHGKDIFTSNITTNNDILDLRPALAATKWNGAASSLSGYLTVTDSASGAMISLASRSGGSGREIAFIDGATKLTVGTLLTHCIT